MWDFPINSTLAHLIEAFNQEEKIISTVCHATVALVNVKAPSGEPLVKGKVVTGFTNSEEKAVGLEAIVRLCINTVWGRWLSLAIPKDAPSVQPVGQPCS